MLRLVTDLKDKSWLNYILQEFIRIENASFEFSIEDFDATQEFGTNTIFYLQNEGPGISFPQRCRQTSLVPIQYLKEDVFVFQNTILEKGYTISYDLLWNAFAFLSRLEEFETEKGGKRINSYSLNHPRRDKSSFDIPIVNNLFRELKNLILQEFPDLQFGPLKSPRFELSHDLDYIKKTLPLRLKQTAFNVFKTLKSLVQPKYFFKNLGRTFSFLFTNPSYWCFDYWQRVEEKYGQKSTFYIYSKYGSIGLKKWLMDPSYDISLNEQLQDELRRLKERGFDIGIHGSFNSADQKGLLKKEIESLQKSLGFEIKKGRQHWLRYSELITPSIHEKLLEEDSTLGWNDRSGFRSGCASKYRLYSHAENRVMDLWITPQLIMDSHLFDYAVNKQQLIFENGVKMIRSLKDYNNVTVSISWHPRTCSSDYNWHHAYEKYLEVISQL